MPTAQKVLRSVLSQIRPNKDQRSRVSSLSRKALSLASKFGKRYKARAMLAGSVTRGTWLPDKMEFDVFVLFPEKMTEKQLERAGLDVGRKVVTALKGKPETSYAQHPYVIGRIGDIRIDVIPAFEVKSAEEIKSAVDRTPFHVKFVEKNLPAKLSDDVLLLKKLLKNAGAYGADTKTEGFSGYVCELLIIHYKGLVNLLKAAKKWRPGEIIDIQGAWKKDDLDTLRKQFFNHALILVDPTDKNRNTAAALSARNFMRLRKIAGEFLSKPSEDFFVRKQPEPITEQELEEIQSARRTQLLFVKFLPPKGVDDVVWPQLRKFAERLKGILEETRYEFKVMGKDVFTDGTFLAAVLLEMEVSKLPQVQKRTGPSIFDDEGAKRFLEKYKESAVAGPYVEGTNWVVETKRQFLTAGDKVRDSLARPLDELLAKGVPKLVADRIAKGFDIVTESSALVEECRRNAAFGSFVRRFFEKEKLT